MFCKPRKSDGKIWSKKRLDREYKEVMAVGIIGIGAGIIGIILSIVVMFIIF